ncbi:MAG: hypothetical protein IKN18_02615 [Neisseriaceae bacterium]|nr:hypothetical protein [Neisseriaceae bacterium]
MHYIGYLGDISALQQTHNDKIQASVGRATCCPRLKIQFSGSLKSVYWVCQ